MLGEAIGGLLPSAIAVTLSPIPIVGVVLVLGTPRARTSGVAFAAGWVFGLTALSAIVVLVLGSGVDHGTESGIEWFKVAVGIAFLLMAAQQWKQRPRRGETAEMPRWMDSVASLTAPKAARPLAAVGQFMSENSAVIMMVVLLLLGAKLLGDGLGGVASL